ncbi:PQQ-dependent sugar dehydrogenase [Sandaracinobacteroides hominis]|uniref:PQQ-dependent sugar dehydrogenase n=1 Tax=Sandaracinobacteroides hominis TaxID=2780086 RepID=UPI0018F5E8E1|nr:PQQ-dependent sugar dehydrogenase [Sandaracinobacteroides hominis]
MLRTLALLASVALGTAAIAAPVPTRVEVVASGLDHPWSLAFLPGGSVLVTERNGKLKRIEGGKVFPVTGVPAVYNEGQGGLFDVVAHPDFNNNGLIFLSYAHGAKQANGTRVARAKLVGNSLIEVTPIYTALPLKSGPVHFGARMAFLPDGTFLLATGDGFDWRERAQKLDSPLGKVMRLTIDGKVPPDNPFVSNPGAQGSIFTRGHRNPQGLAFDPVRGIVFEHEHGPKGGDEVNILKPGANYGWPVATFGMDYSGATISPYTEYKGMTQPIVHWVPSIAPSGLAVYRGAMFPEWQGDLLVGALVDREVRRVHLSPDAKVLGQESLFKQVGERIRDVRVAPDGSVWLTTDDAAGKVLRVTRAD